MDRAAGAIRCNQESHICLPSFINSGHSPGPNIGKQPQKHDRDPYIIIHVVRTHGWTYAVCLQTSWAHRLNFMSRLSFKGRLGCVRFLCVFCAFRVRSRAFLCVFARFLGFPKSVRDSVGRLK